MRVTRKNWWLHLTTPIIGYDEGDGAGAGNQGAGQGGSSEGSGEGSEEGQGSSGTGNEGQGASEDVSGLKSALQKERDDRKALEKELKKYQKAEQDKELANKSEVEQATTKARQAEEKAAKLAAGFRKTAVNSAILKAASAAKFLDPSDALRPEVLEAIGVEQDEDDPSQVTVDEKSVIAAVKALANSKKHYVASGDGSTQRQAAKAKSGSSFGGASNNGNLTADEQALAARYPALSRLN